MGRVEAVWVSPVDPNIIVVGTNASGIWKTTNGGNTWEPKLDAFRFPGLGISDIVYEPNDGILYAGTGLEFFGNRYGYGILISHDDGETWDNVESFASQVNLQNSTVNKIAISPEREQPGAPYPVIVVTTNQVIKSTYIGGVLEWRDISPILNNSNEFFIDAEFTQSSTSTSLFVSTMSENAQGGGANIFKSQDLGFTWVNVAIPYPSSPATVTVLSAARGNFNTFVPNHQGEFFPTSAVFFPSRWYNQSICQNQLNRWFFDADPVTPSQTSGVAAVIPDLSGSCGLRKQEYIIAPLSISNALMKPGLNDIEFEAFVPVHTKLQLYAVEPLNFVDPNSPSEILLWESNTASVDQLFSGTSKVSFSYNIPDFYGNLEFRAEGNSNYLGIDPVWIDDIIATRQESGEPARIDLETTNLGQLNACAIPSASSAISAELYRSFDDGQTWDFLDVVAGVSLQNRLGEFWCSKVDPDLFYFGDDEFYRFRYNGTALVNEQSAYPLHEDPRGLYRYGIGNNEELYCATDGGVSYSQDYSDSWTNLNGTYFPITQFYSVVTPEFSNAYIFGGAQDGNNFINRNGTWELFNIQKGDGGDAQVDVNNPNNFYYTLNRQLRLAQVSGTGFFDLNSSVIETPYNAWYLNYPIAAQVNSQGNNIAYAGGRFDLRENVDFAASSQIVQTNGVVSQVNDVEFHPTQTDHRLVSRGGPTWDPNTPLENRLFKTTDGGQTWIDISDESHPVWGDQVLWDALTFFHPNKIIYHPNDPDIFWLGMNGVNNTSAGEWRVLKTEDGGDSWQDMSNGLPGLPVMALEYRKGSNDMLIAGTDVGVFYWDEPSQEWNCFSNQLPVSIITDLSINYCEGKVYASTYGRGIWSSDLPENTNYEDLTGTISGSFDAYQNLRVPSGQTLTITGTLNMGGGTKLLVEAGAKLIVDGGTITNSCDAMWEGIILEGTATAQQTTQIGGPQGVVELKNGAAIEHANTAIVTIGLLADGSFDWTKTGGVIRATDALFRNNKRAVSFLSYENQNPFGQVLNNQSFFRTCEFVTDGELNDESEPYIFATAYQVRGVRFEGCTFENTSALPSTWRGSGILTMDASVNVRSSCAAPVFGQPCPPADKTPCAFRSLQSGIINLQGGGKSGDINVDEAVFTDCSRGVVALGAQFTEITRNTFNIPKGDLQYPFSFSNFGIYNDNSNGLHVEGNTFNAQGIHGAGIGRDIGTYLNNNQSIVPNDVYRNTYNNLETQVQTAAVGQNSAQIDCNSFNRGGSTIADVFHSKGTLSPQGSCILGPDATVPQANSFAGSCGNGWQLYRNPGAVPISYNSYNQALTGWDNTPTCTESSSTFISQECPPAVYGPPQYLFACPAIFDENATTLQQITFSKTQYLNARSVHATEEEVLKEGGGINLITAVNSTMPDWELRDLLLNASPYLSDAVLIALLNSSRPAWVIEAVLTANEPISDDVLLVAVNRMPKLPDYLMKDLLVKAAPVRSDVMIVFINRSDYPDWVVKDVAVANTPLPDNELNALINRSTPLADWALKDILTINTPLSATVENTLYARQPPLPAWALNQIANSSVVASAPENRIKVPSARAEQEQLVEYLNQEKLVNLNNLVRYYLDTNMVDSALFYLENDGSIEALCAFVPIAGKRDTTRTKQHLTTIRTEATHMDALDPRYAFQKREMDRFCDYYEFILRINRRPGSYLSMTPQERLTLEQFAAGDADIAINARAVINFLDETTTELTAEDYILSTKSMSAEEPKSNVPNQTFGLLVYPNPTFNNFTAVVDISDPFSNAALSIHSVDGKLIDEFEVSNHAQEIAVNLITMQPGIYLVSLTVDGTTRTVEKLVKY